MTWTPPTKANLQNAQEDVLSKQRLENARDYFENVVEPAYRDFIVSEVTFLRVFSLAAGLYHMAEWWWFHEEVKIKAKYGAKISSAGKLWNDVVEQQVSNAGFIRDLNNAAKHVRLRFDPQKPKQGDPSAIFGYRDLNALCSIRIFCS